MPVEPLETLQAAQTALAAPPGPWSAARRVAERRASGLSSALRLKTGAAPVAPNPPLKPEGVDRRSQPRWEGDSDIVLCRRPNSGLTPERAMWLLRSSQFRGRMIDVSMGGVAFDSAETLETGAPVIVRILHRTQGFEVDRTGRILRCTAIEAPEGQSRWMIVCLFDVPLTFDEVHRVGNHLFTATIV